MADGKKPTQQITDFNALYRQAEESQQLYSEQMHKYLDQLKARYPGMLDDVRFEQGPLKSPKRASAKIKDDYGGRVEEIADLVRGRFIVNTPQQADILRKDIAAQAPFKVEKFKDQFAEPLDTQFRAVNAQVRLKNGHLAELRVEHVKMAQASLGAHELYEEKQEIERRVVAESRDYTPEEKILRDAKRDQIGVILDRAAVEGNLDPLLNEKGRTTVAAFRTRVGAARDSIAVLVPIVPHSERGGVSQNPVPILVSPNEHSHTPPPVIAAKPAPSTERSQQPMPVLRKLGLAGATAQLAIGPVFEATLSAANDGKPGDIAAAGVHGLANSALPGVTSRFKNITENHEQQNWLDQALNAGTTATQGVAVGALAVAGGSAAAAPATGGASLTVTAGSMVVAGVSGIANLGIGVTHDVTYWTGLSKQGGLITGLVGMVGQLADSKTGLRVGDWVMNNDATVQRELTNKGIKPNQLTAVDENRDGKVTAQETREYLIKRNDVAAEQVNSLPSKELASKLASVLTTDMLRAIAAAKDSGLSTSIQCDTQSNISHIPPAQAVSKQHTPNTTACR